MTKELLAQIDAEADADNRSRSNWIVTELTAAVKLKRYLRGTPKPFGEAGEKTPGADAGGPSSPSTRRPASAPADQVISDRTNEEPPINGPHTRSARPGIAKTVGRQKGKAP